MPVDAAAASRQTGRLAVALAAVLVLAATLRPESRIAAPVFTWCVVCGNRGLADAFANVILTVPLGAALAYAGMRAPAAVILTFLLSLAIELAQRFLLTGRYPGLGDVIANTAGAAAGVAIVRRQLLARLVSHRWSVAAATLAAPAVLAGTAVLMMPRDAPPPLFGSWTPSKRGFDQYRGRILSATLGPLDLPSRRLPDPARVQQLLRDGAPVELDVTRGEPSGGFEYLFGISAAGDVDQLLFAPDGRDLVVMLHTRADPWRLHRPSLRYEGAMAHAPGDTLRLRWRKVGRTWCLTGAAAAECLGWSAGRGWAVLVGGTSRGKTWLDRLDAAWIGLLLLPAGFLARGRRELAGALAAAAAALFLIPLALAQLPTPPFQWLGATLGASAGLWLRRVALPVTPRPSYNSPADFPVSGARIPD